MNKDEMKMDIKEILKKPYGETITLAEHYISDKQARMLYNANYRKIGKDEIVVKKSKYETLKALKYTNKQLANANKLFAKRNDELLDELQECTDIKAKTKKETAREVFEDIKAMAESNDVLIWVHTYDFDQLAKAYGIELED